MTMTHRTGTREEWLMERIELLEAEKELTRRSDELARRRQALPWVPVEKEYRLETDEGSVSLEELFRGRRWRSCRRTRSGWDGHFRGRRRTTAISISTSISRSHRSSSEPEGWNTTTGGVGIP